MNPDKERQALTSKRPLFFFTYCLLGVLLNLITAEAACLLKIPACFDTIGTMAVSILGGALPGIIVGFVTNLIKCITKSTEMYYAALNMMTALIVAFFSRKRYFRRLKGIVLTVISLTLFLGFFSSIMTWFLNSGRIGGVSRQLAELINSSGVSEFPSLIIAELLTEYCDKLICLLLALGLINLIPKDIAGRMTPTGNWQTPVSRDVAEKMKRSSCRSVSLRTRILAVLLSAVVFVSAIAVTISFLLYKRSSLNDHIKLANGVAELAAQCIDPEKVDAFIEKGEAEAGYTETKVQLYKLRDSIPDIQYLYIYQIREDGCHVVFDLDSGNVEGSKAGEIIPFDDSFKPYLSTLLDGGNIDPIISDDSYGWLLTVYEPVKNSSGECVCYACTDISMNVLNTYGYSFIAKQLSLLLSFFIIILAVGLWIVEYNIILPVNTMAFSAGAFAYNTDKEREKSVKRMKELGIRTGDEIENLYNAIVKTIGDSMDYIDNIQEQSETISNMQNGLILVLADMVESRDKCTGDHVRKTAAYVSLIISEMQKKHFYPDEMTDEFAQNVMNAAPLHDIGKIKISDVILNKPGKLDDEEFEIMKTHTTLGSEIIDRAIEMVSDSDYLRETKNVSEYHHEKWNGKGYPHGISGRDIPLSARIMAVADVFDALVSQRSYKKPFTFEKAMSIIREEAGTHFDPLVAEAFLGAESEVRKIAEDHAKNYNKNNEEY